MKRKSAEKQRRKVIKDKQPSSYTSLSLCVSASLRCINRKKVCSVSESKVLSLASLLSQEEGTGLLLSGGKTDAAKCSLLFCFPSEKIALPASSSAWQELLNRITCDPIQDPIPRWVGFLGYEMGIFADQKKIPYFPGREADAYFYKATCVVSFDHQSQKATIFIQEEEQKKLSSKARTWITKILDQKFWDALPEDHAGFSLKDGLTHIFSSDTMASYCEKIKRAKERILDGLVYQVNLSQQFILQGNTDPFSLFKEVHKINPAPFSAFLQCGDFAIVSSSPERFLHKQGELLETRPIKGTAPRGMTEAEDLSYRQNLLLSKKEKAELLMIVDLMRNDLGRVSQTDSINVLDLFRLETYTNVFHLVAVIQSKALSDLHPVHVIRAAFPGGSITGCPKLAAMEAIASLEKRHRGIYTGSIGYFADNGDFDFNIAIRTLLVREDSIEIHLGGAITHDSDPRREFEETMHKGKSLFQTLGIHL